MPTEYSAKKGEPTDLRVQPANWPDFALRMDTVLLAVLSDDWEKVDRDEIHWRIGRVFEGVAALRKWRIKDDRSEETEQYLMRVYKCLRSLRPKPEYRNPLHDFEAIRRNLLADWTILKEKLKS